ncbi:metallopeptidase TldD-related protein [Caenimonas aquaedulcis]|uniref:TldE/PmbA family protein n=1 Tax=Caenimonas aquaedulcis TaxID=2793270 RepID=A0A931H2A3_9BURK|nr:metallopeptidase TldD-related protein [Caenimonas aquaedulcis]MBG9387246.1 TldE/PmbA family protein [Caenimonas aquaedulcis]
MKRAYFEQLAGAVCTVIPGVEGTSLYLAAEESDFIRFNHAQVRQATHVEQSSASVSVAAGQRRATGTVPLSGDAAADIAALVAERDALVAQLALVPEDKYLLLPEVIASTERESQARLPSAAQVIEAVATHGAGADVVGFYAGGPMIRAYADSRGQRNWHSVASFHFEWCVYRAGDKAVKASYAGTDWSDAEFGARMARARAQSELLELPRKTLTPGDYRVYFTPVAVAELLSTLSWGGFGLKALKTGVSTLLHLHKGDVKLAPSVRLVEATRDGIAPRFQDDGFVKPDAVALVEGGRSAGTLASPRTAREYGVAANGAGGGEAPESLLLAGGDLPSSEVLAALGTGVYVSNLHYLNYSDRIACRMTGMTRFACFWVEDGKLVAPISVMRFDDSFLRMFGAGLVALTRETELVPDSGTYGSRQLSSVTAPGAIVEGFRFTL